MVGRERWVVVQNSDVGGKIEIGVQSASAACTSCVIKLPHVGVAGGRSVEAFLDAVTFVIGRRRDCGQDSGNIVTSGVADAALVLSVETWADSLETMVILVGGIKGLKWACDDANSDNRSDKCGIETHFVRIQ